MVGFNDNNQRMNNTLIKNSGNSENFLKIFTNSNSDADTAVKAKADQDQDLDVDFGDEG